MRTHFALGLAALFVFSLTVHAEDDCAREAALVAQWEAYYQGLEAAGSVDAGELTAFALAADGKWLAGGGGKGELKLWDAELKELRSLTPHKSKILDVCFAPVGGTLATAGEDGDVTVIDVGTGEEKARHARHGKDVRALAITPDGEGVVSGGADGVVGLWTWRSNTWRKIASAKSAILCMALTPDGKAVSFGTEDGELSTRPLEGSNDWSFFGMSWSSSPYTQVLYMPSGSHQVTISRWGVSFDNRQGPLGEADFSGDSASRAAICANGRFAIIGSERGSLAVVPLRFSLKPDVGHVFGGHQLRSCMSLGGLSERVVGLGFSPDGTRVFAADRAGRVVAYRGKTAAPAAFAGNEPLPISNELPPVPHNRHAHSNKLAQEWEDYYCDFAPVARSAFAHGAVNSLEMSADGGEILLATDKGAFLYDATLARPVKAYGTTGIRAGAARFIHGGNCVLVAEGDGGLLLYDRKLGAQLRAFKQQSAAFTCLAVSPDESMFATGNAEGVVQVWDPAQSAPMQDLRGERHAFPGEKPEPEEKAAITCISWSTDGRSLMGGTANGTQFGWETRDWRNNSSGWSSDKSPLYVIDQTPGGDLEVDGRHGMSFRSITNRLDDTSLNLGFAVNSYRNAPSGRFAAIGGDNGHVYMLALAFRAYVEPEDHGNGMRGKSLSQMDPIARYEGLGGAVRGLCFSADGSKLAACSTSGKVAVYSSTKTRPALFADCKPELVSDDEPRPRLPRPKLPREVDPDPVPPKPREEPPAQAPLRKFMPRSMPVLACAWSADGKRFATGQGDYCARIFDGESGDLRQTLAGHSMAVRAVAFSADGLMLATGSDDKTIRIWDCATGQCLKTLSGHTSYVSAVAFLPDDRLFSASADGTCVIWDVASGGQDVTLRGHSRGIEDACVSQDGKVAATASWDGTTRLWDLVEGKETLCLSLERDVPLCVALAPDAASLVVGTRNGKLQLYDLRSGEITRTFHRTGDLRSIYKVAITSDGKTLLRCGGDNELRACELESGNERKHTAPAGAYRCLAPAPDGKTFAVGTHEGAACVWEFK